MMATTLLVMAALGYWAAAIGFQVHLFRHKNRDWQKWTQLVLGSHALHTFGLIALALQFGHLPLTHMREATATFAWLLVALHALLGQRWKVEALGSVAASAAAVLTTIYVLGAGSAYPHYIFLAALEVVSLGLIIWYAWRWPAQEKTAAQLAM